MRIITGTAKGVKLKTPVGMGVRPTADRVKGSIFNILTGRIAGAEVLDLFAGTGNLGLEALSRGAATVVFVENSPVSVALVKENALRTKLADKVEIVKADVLKGLERLHAAQRTFDLIFCDPPYNHGHVARVLKKLDDLPILKSGAILVMEHSRHEPATPDGDKIMLSRTERYGETLISFFQQKH